MNAPHPLNLLQRFVAFFGAAVVTLSLLGGINQLAHITQTADTWAGHADTAHRS